MSYFLKPQKDDVGVFLSKQSICEILDLDYEEIKDKLPTDEEDETAAAMAAVGGLVGDEQETSGNHKVTG